MSDQDFAKEAAIQFMRKAAPYFQIPISVHSADALEFVEKQFKSAIDSATASLREDELKQRALVASRDLTIASLQVENDSLRAQLKQAQVDKERLDWLQQNYSYTIQFVPMCVTSWEIINPHGRRIASASTFREAIDAARGQSPTQGKEN